MALPNKPFAKIFDVLKTFAPTVAAGLGGPAGALVAGLIKQKFAGETDSDTENAVLSAAASPDQIIKLKELEQSAKALEQQLNIRFAELEVQDRGGARDLAVKTSIIPQIVLSAMFIVGYFVILGLFFSKKLDMPMSDAFMVMLGVLTAGVPQVMNFWLGSSSGSQTKGDALASLVVAKREGVA